MKNVTQAALGALTIALFSTFAHADTAGVLIYDAEPAAASSTAGSVVYGSTETYAAAATTSYGTATGGSVPAAPEAVGAALFGGSEPVVYIAPAGQTRAETVEAVEVVDAPRPNEGDSLDMSGRDGTLRSCYASGGIAKQSDDLSYYCTYDAASVGGPAAAAQTAEASPFIVSEDVDTGYNGTTNVRDEALMDCMERGGSLIQLASNNAFACAM